MRLAFSLLALAPLALARLPDGRLHGNRPPRPLPPSVLAPDSTQVVHASTNATLPPLDTIYYFDQLIDHRNPSLGTFKQRYWSTWEFYEPGGPIVLSTPGEANAAPYTGYLTNRTINGQIAQQQKGATIVLEHRYFGLSNPFSDLSVASLKYHTVQQAIDDLAYFADNVKLPMPGGDQVPPSKAPWILIGGSYSGALTAFTKINKPDSFYIGYASSAVVESITNFWAYFEPVRQYMPKNCSSDVEAVVAHFDRVLTSGNNTAIAELKHLYGMDDVVHADDVSGALRNNLWNWQDLDADSGGSVFYDFCDAIEVKDGVSAPASGWGLEHALTAWGTYWTSTYMQTLCGGDGAEDCLGTYNTTQSFWTDTSLDNPERSWMWLVCNEFGFFQDTAPPYQPSIVSRIVTISGDERQCQQMFPEAFKGPANPKAWKTNAEYDGWFLRANRLFIANGVRDPWRYATVSSGFVDIPSTPQQPIAVGDGFHCSDLITRNGAVDPTILKVQQSSLSHIKKWLAEWKPAGSGHYYGRGNEL
ncbi:peptidase S28 [Artomyces pyxidatus]|uniref:Peptidase S28 n=1 Tax=Artomyces pyxidatus TaxID=48021 RepID=A0ACB8TBP5_9AGAM|nr:peptidase S28 [Artomyces pyxidatus]